MYPPKKNALGREEAARAPIWTWRQRINGTMMVLYTELNTPVCHANKRQSTEGTKPDYRLIGTSYLLYVLSVDVANCFLLGVVEADYCKSEV